MDMVPSSFLLTGQVPAQLSYLHRGYRLRADPGRGRVVVAVASEQHRIVRGSLRCIIRGALTHCGGRDAGRYSHRDTHNRGAITMTFKSPAVNGDATYHPARHTM